MAIWVIKFLRGVTKYFQNFSLMKNYAIDCLFYIETEYRTYLIVKRGILENEVSLKNYVPQKCQLKK